MYLNAKCKKKDFICPPIHLTNLKVTLFFVFCLLQGVPAQLLILLLHPLLSHALPNTGQASRIHEDFKRLEPLESRSAPVVIHDPMALAPGNHLSGDGHTKEEEEEETDPYESELSGQARRHSYGYRDSSSRKSPEVYQSSYYEEEPGSVSPSSYYEEEVQSVGYNPPTSLGHAYYEKTAQGEERHTPSSLGHTHYTEAELVEDRHTPTSSEYTEVVHDDSPIYLSRSYYEEAESPKERHSPRSLDRSRFEQPKKTDGHEGTVVYSGGYKEEEAGEDDSVSYKSESQSPVERSTNSRMEAGFDTPLGFPRPKVAEFGFAAPRDGKGGFGFMPPFNFGGFFKNMPKGLIDGEDEARSDDPSVAASGLVDSGDRGKRQYGLGRSDSLRGEEDDDQGDSEQGFGGFGLGPEGREGKKI